MYAVFGSEDQDGDASLSFERGLWPLQSTEAQQPSEDPLPAFCGGAGAPMEEPMDVEPGSQGRNSEIDTQHKAQAPLDYVLQNLQYRLGNPRKFTIPLVDMVMGGSALWCNTTDAVMTTLMDEGVVYTSPNSKL